ncbi:MFS transporter [Bacillus fonticola]|uniref:MFS transporter n=1 Tax=Bacillus fonticola TaxID=2728853 RepID=UPI001474F090|nr:MFS transporter [Bacillus fonticola]
MEHIGSIHHAFQKKEASSEGDDGKTSAVLALSSIPLVMTLGNSMLIPVLPTMEKQLSISSFQSSLIITVYSIVAILLIPVAGFLSDKLGRKAILIPSLIIAGVGGLVSGFAAWFMKDAYFMILIGRTLQGIGASGAAPIVIPLVGDMFKSEEKVSSSLGIIETANTLGKVLSPILGALLAAWIWFIPFFSFPIFCLAAILLVAFLVKAPKQEQKNKTTVKEYGTKLKKIFKDNGRWLYTTFIIGGVMMFVLFGVLFYLSSTLEDAYAVKDVKKGLYLAIPLGALCLTSFGTGMTIKKNKVLMKWLTFSGIVILGIAVVLTSFSDNLWYLISMFAVSGIGIGMALPCLDAMITEGIEKEQRGTITCLYSSMRFVGVALGPPIIAIVMKSYETPMFYGLAGLCAISALLSFFAIKPENDEGAPQGNPS